MKQPSYYPTFALLYVKILNCADHIVTVAKLLPVVLTVLLYCDDFELC